MAAPTLVSFTATRLLRSAEWPASLDRSATPCRTRQRRRGVARVPCAREDRAAIAEVLLQQKPEELAETTETLPLNVPLAPVIGEGYPPWSTVNCGRFRHSKSDPSPETLRGVRCRGRSSCSHQILPPTLA